MKHRWSRFPSWQALRCAAEAMPRDSARRPRSTRFRRTRRRAGGHRGRRCLARRARSTTPSSPWKKIIGSARRAGSIIFAAPSGRARRMKPCGSCASNPTRTSFHPNLTNLVSWSAKFSDAIRQGFSAFVDRKGTGGRAGQLKDFRVLSALRRGPFGVEGLNRKIEGILREAGLDPAACTLRVMPESRS